MRAPAKPKPQAVDEVARVLRIARMIDDELRVDLVGVIFNKDTEIIGPAFDILAVAERIAARTEG